MCWPFCVPCVNLVCWASVYNGRPGAPALQKVFSSHARGARPLGQEHTNHTESCQCLFLSLLPVDVPSGWLWNTNSREALCCVQALLGRRALQKPVSCSKSRLLEGKAGGVPAELRSLLWGRGVEGQAAPAELDKKTPAWGCQPWHFTTREKDGQFTSTPPPVMKAQCDQSEQAVLAVLHASACTPLPPEPLEAGRCVLCCENRELR